MKILVVEDNEFNLKLVRTLLQIKGYTVIEAMDAETGIKLAKKHCPNLILMDIQLPGLDGLSATRILRGDKLTRDIPIVAVTSFAMEGDEQKTIDAGCAGYISKPLDTRTFLDEVDTFLYPNT